MFRVYFHRDSDSKLETLEGETIQTSSALKDTSHEKRLLWAASLKQAWWVTEGSSGQRGKMSARDWKMNFQKFSLKYPQTDYLQDKMKEEVVAVLHCMFFNDQASEMSLKTTWRLPKFLILQNKRNTVIFILRVKEHIQIWHLWSFLQSILEQFQIFVQGHKQTFSLVWQATPKYRLTFNLEVPLPPLFNTCYNQSI